MDIEEVADVAGFLTGCLYCLIGFTIFVISGTALGSAALIGMAVGSVLGLIGLGMTILALCDNLLPRAPSTLRLCVYVGMSSPWLAWLLLTRK